MENESGVVHTAEGEFPIIDPDAGIRAAMKRYRDALAESKQCAAKCDAIAGLLTRKQAVQQYCDETGRDYSAVEAELQRGPSLNGN